MVPLGSQGEIPVGPGGAVTAGNAAGSTSQHFKGCLCLMG